MSSVWSYTRKRAKEFRISDNYFGDEEFPWERLLLSSLGDGKLLKDYGNQLRHGDIINFGEYRGCGCYIVEPVDENASDFYLWKTLGEMGYAVPLCFSDAPSNYYEDTEQFHVFRHSDFVPPGHAFWEEVKMVQEDPEEARNINLEEFPDDYIFFEDYLDGAFTWIPKSEFEHYNAENWSFWKERLRLKSLASRTKSARSVSSGNQ